MFPLAFKLKNKSFASSGQLSYVSRVNSLTAINQCQLQTVALREVRGPGHALDLYIELDIQSKYFCLLTDHYV